MSKDYQEFQNFNADATGKSSGNNWWKNPGLTMNREDLQSPHVICGLSSLFAGLLFVIIILVVTITNNGVNQTESSLDSNFKNLNTSLKTKVESLAQDGAGIMEKIKEIDLLIKKTSKDTTMMNKLTEIDTLVKGILSDEVLGSLQSDVQRILNAVGKLREEIRKENSTQDPLCSLDWKHNALSCYYVSQKSRQWPDAKKDCEDKMSHLVVINNAEEQEYVIQLTQGITTWIGLTDMDGSWKWVDGTSYVTTPKFWLENQPDNWISYYITEIEDCAQIKNDGWNDDRCSRRFQYICEKKIS